MILIGVPAKADRWKLWRIKKRGGFIMIDSRCGLHCTDCEYKDSCGCGGCIETKGNPFHGECPVAVCCQNKGLTHCGECPDIPCELLMQYSCDPEHGDEPHGARIEQCKQWKLAQWQRANFCFAKGSACISTALSAAVFRIVIYKICRSPVLAATADFSIVSFYFR